MSRILNEAGGALLTEAGGNLLAEATSSGAAAASLSGTGTLSAGGSVTVPGFAPVGSASSSTAHTFTLTPHAAGNFFLVGVISETAADYATALSSSNVTWSVLVAHTAFTANAVVETVFIGVATSTSSATVTVTFAAGNPTTRTAWQEFSASLGYGAVRLDTSSTVDVASSGSFPSLTPSHGAGELYWGYLFDSGTGTAGSTAGFSYFIDPNGNPMTYNPSCGTGAQHPNIGDSSDGVSGLGALLYQAITLFSGAAALSGTGSLAAAGPVAQQPAVALSGSGSLAAAGTTTVLPSAALVGEGFVAVSATVTVPGAGSASLSGTGTLTTARSAGYADGAGLSGTGTLGAQETGTIGEGASLSGTGALSVAGKAALKFTAGLFGGGFLAIPQVAGGLVNGVGGAGTPMALPGSSQVAVAAPGSSNWQWIGTLGQVTALTYSYVCPGGADKMTCTVMVPASYQSQLFYPGWQVKIVRGGMDIWHGKLDEPSYQPGQGWTLTAVGNGNRGQDFNAYYAVTWPGSEPDEVIGRAIGRGLPWASPGYNSASFASQFWFGQSPDAGSQKVSDFLNMICSRGGLTWYVNSLPGGIYGADDLQIFPLPTTPSRLLVCTTPVARTLGGYTNYILIRYQASTDNATAGTAATYAYATATNPASIAAHGPLEAYFDLSDAPVMTAAQAQAVGAFVLQLYVAASYAGPFTVSYGQLLNTGGQPVDIGCDGAGSMVKLVLADSSYGGSVDMSQPVTFIVGSYSYNDMTQTAQISPFATLDQSLSGLLSMESAALTPITAAST